MAGIQQALFGGFGAVGDFESIATANGTGASATISFTSIPATYKHLQLRIMVLASISDQPVMRVGNGSIDTGANYTRHSLNGNGASAAAYGAATNYMNVYGYRVGGSTTNPTVGIVDLLDYAKTTKNKTFRMLSGMDNNGTGEVDLNSGSWLSTSAIDQIQIFAESGSNWTTASHFALYGSK